MLLMLPDWHAALRHAKVAHRACSNIAFVGWDIAFTDHGPMLLEGNANWTADEYQSLTGEPLGHTKFATVLAARLKCQLDSRSGLKFKKTGLGPDLPLPLPYPFVESRLRLVAAIGSLFNAGVIHSFMTGLSRRSSLKFSGPSAIGKHLLNALAIAQLSLSIYGCTEQYDSIES